MARLRLRPITPYVRCRARQANFQRARFSGRAEFREAQFSGTAWFNEAQFRGDAGFSGARFRTVPDFKNATVRSENGRHVWPEPWYIQPISDDSSMARLVRT
jgi:uncharacterized protein YjbI with pentapeptide repeats